MSADLAFWKRVVDDRSDFLERTVALLADHGIRYCVIGGVAVNAYAEPVLTQDLDIVIATDQVEEARRLFELEFKVRQFTHSLNVYDPDSKLQVQIQLPPEDFPGFVERAREQEVLGLVLPVAAPEDLIGAKIAAALEPARRPSKRQKDLADISRLIETFPELLAQVPEEIRSRLFL